MIERFVLVGCAGVSPATRRTLRTNLRALARSLERYPEPSPVPLARERAKRPYSPAEIDGFLRLADAQSTRARRLRASALVCLGAGAGVIAGELRHVRGSDIGATRGRGARARLRRRRARSVPVLERYREQRSSEAAVFAGERYVIGGRNPDRRNVTDTLSAALSTDLGLPRLQAGRLRWTWLLESAARIGLGAFMQAAGISCSQRLGDLAAELPAATEDGAGRAARRGLPVNAASELERLERIIDTAGVSSEIELLLPVGVRPRQLKVRTLLAAVVLVAASRDAPRTCAASTTGTARPPRRRPATARDHHPLGAPARTR